ERSHKYITGPQEKENGTRATSTQLRMELSDAQARLHMERCATRYVDRKVRTPYRR
ncbi:hypothetical protein HAX54_001975, partial [Datura stramonium]|nr:hypothetical protein [Datura stramonium]